MYLAPACSMWLFLGVLIVEWPTMAKEGALGLMRVRVPPSSSPHPLVGNERHCVWDLWSIACHKPQNPFCLASQLLMLPEVVTEFVNPYTNSSRVLSGDRGQT